MCLQLELTLNALSHLEQANCFSTVWVLSCIFKMAFLLCGSFHVSSNWNSQKMLCHIWSRQIASLLCGSSHVSSKWLFSCVGPFMCLQTGTHKKCFVTFGEGKLLLYCVGPLMYLQNGFSPVWVLSCVFKLELTQNALSHLEKANCFSTVWVLSCIFKMALLLCGSFHCLQTSTHTKCFVTFGAGKLLPY